LGVLSWWLFSTLTQPVVVFPLILALIGLPWLSKRIRRKRLWSGLGGALLAIYLLAVSPLGFVVASKLLVSFLPSDPGTPTDAIVVLGRGTELRPDRVEVATQLWQAKRAPLVFASGRGDATEIAQMLEAKGLPPEAVDGEPCSRTTEENAQFTAALLKPHRVQRILLVTDPPHMLRSLLTFRSFGMEVIPHATSAPTQLDPKHRTFLVFREYLGLLGYGLMGRFSEREAPAAATVSQMPATAPVATPSVDTGDASGLPPA
jgi:uncharacterized SAM-binding protein YcdF (DUF218 family)